MIPIFLSLFLSVYTQLNMCINADGSSCSSGGSSTGRDGSYGINSKGGSSGPHSSPARSYTPPTQKEREAIETENLLRKIAHDKYLSQFTGYERLRQMVGSSDYHYQMLLACESEAVSNSRFPDCYSNDNFRHQQPYYLEARQLRMNRIVGKMEINRKILDDYWKIHGDNDEWTRRWDAGHAGQIFYDDGIKLQNQGLYGEALLSFEFAEALVDLATSITPVVSWARDLYEAFHGTDFITGEELSDISRSIAIASVATLGSVGHVAKAAKAFKVLSRFHNVQELVKDAERLYNIMPHGWSRGKMNDSVLNAVGHFGKHGKEFPHLKDSMEYIEATHAFIKKPPTGTLTKISKQNGNPLFFNHDMNILAVQDKKTGFPSSMYKLNNPKYKNIMEQWNDM